jgi:fibrillarin-like rRNA methylase
LGLATGTQFGEINPIIIDGAVYSFEFLLSKVDPLVRWYDTVQVVKIDGQVECVAVMQEG